MEKQAALRMLLTLTILCFLYNGVHGTPSLAIDMKLKALNKPALKTIKSEDGDIIDCVDIYKQPAFDHPALRNHKIQMKPSVELGSKENNSPTDGSSKPVTSQIWSKSGRCPVGTIPIRRVSREDISRASSPSSFGRKPPHVYNTLYKSDQHTTNSNSTTGKKHNPRPKNRSEAMFFAVGSNYLGAQSNINVWNPPGVQKSDYSSAQMWLLAGDQSEMSEIIEAGWMVNPRVFGDNRTRFFAYWTKDAYRKTGCINLLCSGFVQTSKHVALGAAIEPVSSSGHEQYYIMVKIYQDPQSKNWWLSRHDKVYGYWPSAIFKHLPQGATQVQWGGEVYSPNVRKKPHTKTPMGSGESPIHLWGKACYHAYIRIKDASMQLKYPMPLAEFSDENQCYTTILHKATNVSEPYLYFGGSGQSTLCP
ncbi:hypothetical protein Bca52824_029973 [Brassica carinata]|uniref:Neprosin PEP catalytic domain-containing protein n=1 Tax=Brassica carinata TaxID=52824 RepID=A0A8X7V3Z9_BRACI|nr:hypothetical protein Bca52824_029973 [Brassica carinata]